MTANSWRIEELLSLEKVPFATFPVAHMKEKDPKRRFNSCKKKKNPTEKKKSRETRKKNPQKIKITEHGKKKSNLHR